MTLSATNPGDAPTTSTKLVLAEKTQKYVNDWSQYIRGGFPTLPIAVESTHGHIITDVDGKDYIDFIGQMAVMNFGYSNPKIAKAVADQVFKFPLTGTYHISPLYTEFAKRVTQKFGFDSIITMLSGSEAVESAVKIARKWAYLHKGITQDRAHVLTVDQCYHGLTLSTMPMATVAAKHFGQHLPNLGPYAPTSKKLIPFGNIQALTECFEQDAKNLAAFIVEPVQGWAGTIVPPVGYLKAVQALCRKHNVLLICDEIQAGYGRTGKDLSFQHEPELEPDMVIMGKAVTGGYYPMSVVMGKKYVMDLIQKNEILSTFGASPIACAAALASLDVLEEERISERSERLGEVLKQTIKSLNPPRVKELRGTALFQSLVLDCSVPGVTPRRVSALAMHRGVLVGIGADRLRFSPPLTISEEDLVKAVTVVAQALKDVTEMGDFPGSEFMN
ncbi:pyridoxal phosphate-dependent transferase [Fusarium venenatum]|uniref:pyridoxal phosphate-dependent transferase n=1 Tax=Fusarium venenatum TaxID=56646 RepID=UPI001D3B5A84|nr:pyridoxal phosphate-dependent transferase [Fusarium venenatum]